MIKNFEPRLYQQTIFSTCTKCNTLVVLPTGLGKTNVFLMVAAQRLKEKPDSKILFVGPTRPLISQYMEVFKKNFDIDESKLAMFTGYVKPAKREELWKSCQIFFSTPQGLENDIIAGRIDLKDVSLLGVDEAHRAVGDYAYVWVAQEYNKRAKDPRILALTASPGSDREKIMEVCENLCIEDVEVRTQKDPDVKPYVQEVKVRNVMIDLPAKFLQAKKYLDACFKSKIKNVKENGFGRTLSPGNVSKRELLALQMMLVGEMNKGNRSFEVLKSLSLVAEAMKVSHGVELLESQGLFSLSKYIEKLFSEARSSKVKAVQNLVQDHNFKSARVVVEDLVEKGEEHPKFGILSEIAEKTTSKKDSKMIVFTQYRDTAVKIKEVLDKSKGVKSEIFVGQAKKNGTGLTQKEQIAMIEKFRDGEFNVIIMTSVGEEGLDIPKVDQVVFFEPVPSVIRHIQRRGRTGRQEKGDVLVLVAKKTRDEAYLWSSKHKERRMYDVLEKLRKEFAGLKEKKNKVVQTNLNDAALRVDNKRKVHEEKSFNKTNMSKDKPSNGLNAFMNEEKVNVSIFADYREKGSLVLKELFADDIKINLEKLEVADFVLSPRVGVEYKQVKDFVDSVVDGRLLEQIKNMKNNFERPLIIVEGTEDIYNIRNVHPNAIRGMLATITVGYGIPILYTRTSKETSEIMRIIATREQTKSKGKAFSLHATKKPMTTEELQEYIVSALPNVGPQLAKDLLKHFGSVRAVVSATEDELMKVDKVGRVIASRIREVIDAKFVK